MLEYYRPSANQWFHVWSVRGGVTAGQDTFFTKVNIPLLDSTFLENGFRFRFRSYGSLSGGIDLWHLDYVLLKDYGAGGFTNDIKEIAFVNRNVSLIHPFTSMPWNDYKINPSLYVKDSISMHYKNLSSTPPPFNIDFSDQIFDENGQSVYLYHPGSNNVIPLANVIYSIPLNSDSLPVTNADKATFTSVHKLSDLLTATHAPDLIRTNDSVVFKYKFDNYYSYDDGTSEIGYDLVNSPGGKLAMRFDLAQPDTLRAVRMLFVQQNVNVSNKLFTLKIWSSLSPETIIYQQQNLKPVYTDSIDGMATYVIPPTPVQGTIYIGFQQIFADGLHLGFDRNTKNNSLMFYNVTGTWTNVAVADGSFMIHAVMGDSLLFLGMNENDQNQSDIFIYPNPANDFVQCNVGNNSSLKNVSLSDATGRMVLNNQVSTHFTLDVKDLPCGFYLLNFTDDKHRLSINKKLVISR